MSGVPSTLAIAARRVGVENKNLWRDRSAFGFTVAFPVMMLLLFASIFGATVEGTTVDYSQLYVAGILGSTFMSTAFVNLAMGMALERDSGMLQRLSGTPMPKSSYFLGKIGMVLVTLALETVVLLGLGVLLFDLSLPASVGRWLVFGAVLLLGVGSSTLLGITVGSLIKNSRSAPAVVNLPFVALQFISGVWIAPSQLPAWLTHVSQVFPLHWICRSMRYVFLPDEFKVVESGGEWSLGLGMLVLVGWCVLGFLAAIKTFRFTRG